MSDQASLTHPFRHYLRRHRTTVLTGALWLFLTNAFETVVPWLVGRALDRITAGDALSSVSRIILALVGVIIGLSAFRFLWRIYWASFQHAVAEDLRNRLYERMTRLGPSFFQPRKIGQLISLISNDVNGFRMGIGPGLLLLLDGLMLIILILPVMFSISITWTWQTLILMPIVPFGVRWILGRLHFNFHARQTRFADMSGAAQEIISGIRTIKSFAREDAQTKAFNVHSRSFQGACDRVASWDAFFGPSLELPVALGSVILLLLGAPQVISGAVTLGSFFAFYQYVQRMIWPMSAVGIGLSQVQEAGAAFKRIREVLEFEPDVVDLEQDAVGAEIGAFESLEVRGLSFTYPRTTTPVLEKVSFTLNAGESLGIVGLTGAGKTTLIELLTRQYPVPSDTILINGISVERIRLADARRLFGVVPQDAFLFSRPVSDNVALGLERWDLEQVRAATRQVRLDDEVSRWPNGYDALVGERGVNLSGGQKQRLTLARALIRQAPLVILDDALSAVDAKTEDVILQHLGQSGAKTTSIVVSHRLASLRDTDRILVLDSGRVEWCGNAADGRAESATYRALYEMQVGGA